MNSSRSWHGSSQKPKTKSDTQTSDKSDTQTSDTQTSTVSSFAWGPESHYRLTWAAYQRREEWLSPDLDLSDPRT